jgi:alpha-L-fucosidase
MTLSIPSQATGWSRTMSDPYDRRKLLGGALPRALVLLALLAGGLAPGTAAAQQPSGAPGGVDVEALRSRPFPAWFADAKLGIFIHWGVYSVPAYSGREQYAEWFLRGLQTGDTLRTRFLRENFGENFTYRDFAPRFTAELFRPGEWAELFRRAGARYVVLTAKHHDGYALWPSRYAPGWNSVEVGPRRDVVGELTDAVLGAGLRMGLYYSLPEWDHPLYRWTNDPRDRVGEYVERHMVPQFKELVAAYRPSVIFSDGEWDHPAETWRAHELIAWYYDLVGPDAIVNDRWGEGADIGFLTPEYSSGLQTADRPWAEVRGLGRSFGLNRNEPLEAYMSAEELIRFFARTVASGGGMILNVGPGADGQIPLLQQERLLELGRWLEVNGEAIYGARAWSRSVEEREVVLRRVDPAVDFNWVRNSPGRPIAEDHFTATWTGYLQPRFSEVYRFDAEADDGVRVWIDDVLVVDRWEDADAAAEGNVMGDRAVAREQGTIRLERGRKYPIRVEFYEKTHNARVHLYWSSASQPRQIVPRSQLFSAAELEEGDGLQAVYRSLQPHLAYTRNGDDLFVILLEWPDGELALPIAAPPPGTRVTLLGSDGDLPWHHADGTLNVDLAGVRINEMRGNHAWTLRLRGYLAES